MIGRLRCALAHIEELSPDAQQQVAELIEQHVRLTHIPLETPAGAWSDLPDTFDEMLDALDRIRHSTPPTPQIDE